MPSGAGEHPQTDAIPGLVLSSPIAHGLFASVFKARMVTAEGYEQTVAVKLLKSGHKARASHKLNDALLSLKHVNLVRHLTQGTTADGTSYIVMEHVRGPTLQALLEHGPIEVSRAVGISRQLARALVALHGMNLVHGDLKPNHVLLVGDERHEDHIKLCDVGAKPLDWVKSNVDEATWLERAAYVAPEQLSGDSIPTPRIDLYSAGVILFQMLTGSVPDAEQPATKLVAILPRYVPRALKDIVLRLLQKEPSLRFASAENWLTALDRIDGRDQDDEEPSSSSPRSAFIASGMSRTAPPGSVRPASSLRRAPWGLDAGGFKLWAVACGLAALGAATIVGYRMYTHSGQFAADDPNPRDSVNQTTNAQQGAVSPAAAEALRVPPEARNDEQWLAAFTYYLDASQWENAENTLAQALSQRPNLVRGSKAGLLVRRLGQRRDAFLSRLEGDTALANEVRVWAKNNRQGTSP